MKGGVGICAAALLLSACASTTGGPTHVGTPLATGTLVQLKSHDSAVEGGLVWTGTAKTGAPCAVYEGWVRISKDGEFVWIPREAISYVQLHATSD